MLRVSVFELALSGLSPITLTRNTFSQFSLKRSGQQCAFAGMTIAHRDDCALLLHRGTNVLDLHDLPGIR
jgi:hypothetical protein